MIVCSFDRGCLRRNVLVCLSPRRRAFGFFRVLSDQNCGTEYGRCAISSSNGLEEMLPGLILACKFTLTEISGCTESAERE